MRNTVWANEGGEAFLFIDNRYGTPQWVIDQGWWDTGDTIGMDEGGNGVVNQVSRVYRKLFEGDGPVGFVLHENFQNGGNNYGVAYLVPEPGSLMGLLAMGGLLVRRRK